MDPEGSIQHTAKTLISMCGYIGSSVFFSLFLRFWLAWPKDELNFKEIDYKHASRIVKYNYCKT